MFKKYLTLVLTVLVFNLFLVSTMAYAETKAEENAKFAEKVKANITKIGTGKDTCVEIRLKDGTKLKGYISQINETNFVIVDEKTAITTEIPYSNAKQVKGNNLSTGVKVALVVAGVLALLVAVSYALKGAD